MAKGGPQGGGSGSERSRLPRGRHGLPRRVVVENQRQRLIAGIIAAVAERGYGETTVEAIVKAAELSKKTFYEHFRNKAMCFEAAYGASYEYLEAVIVAIEPQGKWGETVRARLEALLGALAAEPDLANFFLVAPTSVGDKVAERHHQSMRQLVATLLKGEPKTVRRSGQLETQEQAFAGGLARLIVRKLGDDEAASIPDLLPALTELMLWPYLGGEEAVRIAEA